MQSATHGSSLRPALLAGRSVAVVHEWFSAHGGSEDVFLAIAGLVPHATRYVLWTEPDAPVDGLDLRQSWLARTPLRRSKALALPLMPLAWRTLGRPAPEVVISSSHAFAHTVKLGAPAETRHLSYIHSPARYLWSPAFDGRGANPALALPRRLLQGIDVRASRHVHAYAANSEEVRARIERYWRRDATVVHPPVDTEFFATPAPEGPAGDRDYLLGVGRWIPYKNFDLVIEIAARAGVPLVVAGAGPEESALRKAAAAHAIAVTFEHRPTRDRLRSLYQGARALLFPAHEDFGIVPVEAQAAGTPVVGLRRGGLCETVVDGETGFLVDSLDPAAYGPAIGRLDELDRDRIRAHATTFSADRFRARMTEWVSDATR